MAKGPVTRERCVIHAEMSLEQMGFAIAALTRLGITNLGHELVTDVRTFHNNPDRKAHEISAETFAVRTFLPHHGRFSTKDIIKHFKEHGRAASSVYYALSTMTKNGTLTKIDSGWYEVAPKQLAAPKPDEATSDMFGGGKPAAEEHPKKWDRAGKEEILHFMKDRERFNTKELRALFKEQGRKEASVSPSLHELLSEKRIKRTGGAQSGEYLVLHNKPKHHPAE